MDSGGGAAGAIVPLKTYKATLFTMILNNSEKSIRDIRSFCLPLFCHSSVVKYRILHLSYSTVVNP